MRQRDLTKGRNAKVIAALQAKPWSTFAEIQQFHKTPTVDYTATLYHLTNWGVLTRRRRNNAGFYEYRIVSLTPVKPKSKKIRKSRKAKAVVENGEDTLLDAAANYQEYRKVLIQIRDTLNNMGLD